MYRRRRVVAGLVALAVVVAVVLLSVVAVGALTSRTSAPAGSSSGIAGVEAGQVADGHTYVVQPGDTLWAIAARVAPDGDIRAVVDALAERTGGADLRVGQTIDLDGLG